MRMVPMIKFYGYKKCSTCRQAEKYLTKNRIEFTFYDITVAPPPEKILKSLIKSSELELKEWFNRSGVVYREQNFKEKMKTSSEAQLISDLSNNGKLIKRPLVYDDNDLTKSTVGFKDKFIQTWKSK